MGTYRALAVALDTTPPFTDEDLDWFRKPLRLVQVDEE
jgi:hypothetical protein